MLLPPKKVSVGSRNYAPGRVLVRLADSNSSHGRGFSGNLRGHSDFGILDCMCRFVDEGAYGLSKEHRYYLDPRHRNFRLIGRNLCCPHHLFGPSHLPSFCKTTCLFENLEQFKVIQLAVEDALAQSERSRTRGAIAKNPRRLEVWMGRGDRQPH